jgi:hypothetical protein
MYYNHVVGNLWLEKCAVNWSLKIPYENVYWRTSYVEMAEALGIHQYVLNESCWSRGIFIMN